MPLSCGAGGVTRPTASELLAQVLSLEFSFTVKSGNCPGSKNPIVESVELSVVMSQTWPFGWVGRVYPFHLSSRGRRIILERGRTIWRRSTLFPSYACGEHLQMSGSHAPKSYNGLSITCRRRSAMLSPSSSSSTPIHRPRHSPGFFFFWQPYRHVPSKSGDIQPLDTELP